MAGVTDWISSTLGLLVLVIALVTLFTVYVAALQVLSQRRVHKHGLSRGAIGPWRPKVFSSSLLGLRSTLSTPAVGLSKLIEKNWDPNFVFPLGIDSNNFKTTNSDIEHHAEPPVLARTSWVNFMQAIGISPEDETLFDMQFESALLNGNIPMRWRGPDLVGMCSMLGFQSHEKKPVFHDPMPLPMQWNGPLGFLQFRAGYEGCVVEFRRRAVLGDELPSKFYKYYKHREERLPTTLVSRLCHSMGGLSVEKDGKRRLFFIGSCDYEKILELLLEGAEKKKDDGPDNDEEGKKKAEEAKSEQNSERRDSIDSLESIFQELETKSLNDDEILEKVWGVPLEESRRNRGHGPKKGEIRSELVKNAADENQKKKREERGVMEVIKPSPGFLSIVIQSEMACSRGLDLTDCIEYDRAFVLEDMVDEDTYPYKLGNMAMNLDTLKLFKDAMLLLKPDGFYFSPAGTLSADMKLVAKASACLQNFIEPTGQDLVWAMLVCPKLFSGLASKFGKLSISDLKAIVKIQSQKLDCTALMGSDTAEPEKVLVDTTAVEKKKAGESSDDGSDDEDEDSHIYSVPLCADGEFSTTQLVSAFLDVCLTFYWLERKWITDVNMYSAAIPPTVIMF